MSKESSGRYLLTHLTHTAVLQTIVWPEAIFLSLWKPCAIFINIYQQKYSRRHAVSIPNESRQYPQGNQPIEFSIHEFILNSKQFKKVFFNETIRKCVPFVPMTLCIDSSSSFIWIVDPSIVHRFNKKKCIENWT